MMKKIQFKTSLKCNHCVAKVKEALDATAEIANWSIDLKNPSKILTVESEQESVVELVVGILVKNGFRAEVMDV